MAIRARINTFVWGAVVGAIGWWIALYAGFGWVSPDSAAQLAASQAQTAVVAYAAPACVARFAAQPDAVVARKALQAAYEYKRSDIIKKGGWLLAAPAGATDQSDAIASECAQQILALKKIGGVDVAATK